MSANHSTLMAGLNWTLQNHAGIFSQWVVTGDWLLYVSTFPGHSGSIFIPQFCGLMPLARSQTCARVTELFRNWTSQGLKAFGVPCVGRREVDVM